MGPSRRVRAFVLGLDVVGLVVGLVGARALWLASLDGAPARPHAVVDLLGPNPHMPAALLLALVWAVAMRVEGLYDPFRMGSGLRIAQAMVRATAWVFIAAALLQWLTPTRTWSRTLLASFVGLSSLWISVSRLLFFRAQAWMGGVVAPRGLLVVGTGPEAALFVDRLERFAPHAWKIVGAVRVHADPPDVSGPALLGDIAELPQIMAKHPVSLVVLATRQIAPVEAMQVATQCARRGLDVVQVPFTWGIAAARVESAALGELELVRVGGLSYPPVAVAAKRLFDVVAVLLGGAVLLPVLLGVAAAVKLHDGGPIFYVSPRAGKGGRPFPFFKFRSMVVDADRLRAATANEADGRLFKSAADPRITPLGAWLRRWSIDELPQLWNVLRGDMNLVGPRPLPVEDLAGIERDAEHSYWFEERSRVNPGITGLWQVSGRSDLSFQRMVELDVAYIQHWSLLLDLQILIRTIPAVLRGRGAR